MSNILQKLFIEEPVLISGYTISRWNPPVTRVTTTPVVRWVPGTSYSQTITSFGVGFNPPSPYYTVAHYTDGSTTLLESGIPLTKEVSFVQINALNGLWSVIEYFNADGSTTTTINGTTAGYYETNYVTKTVTSPGYYSYTIQPDTYEIVYNPNTGWNSSARSIVSILGNGTATFSPRVDVTGAVVGLNEVYDSIGSDYFEISFGIFFKRGFYKIVEQGVVKTSSLAYVSGDIFSISRTDNEIFYAINNQVFYKSTILSFDELLLDCSLYSGGDSIYNASLVNESDVVSRFAAITAIGNLYARPKATAAISAQATLAFKGVYSNANGVNAAVNITAVATLTNNKQFGGYPVISSISTLTSIGRTLTGVKAALGGLTANATSGYEIYAEVVASLPSMTASAGAGSEVVNFTYIAAGFDALILDARCLTGETNLDHTVSLQPLSVLGTTHNSSGTVHSKTSQINAFSVIDIAKVTASASILANSTVYFNGNYTLGGNSLVVSKVNINAFSVIDIAKVTASASILANSTVYFNGTYTDNGDLNSYAGMTGELGAMAVYAGQFPDLGNFAVLPFITSTLVVSGYSSDVNSAALTFIDSTIEGYGGAITEEDAINFIDLSAFSCIGTHLDYGNANVAFSTFTLSSTGIGYGTSNASIGFISSTITSFGGANSELTAPVFTLASTGSYIPLGNATLDFLTWSVSSTGTLDAIGNATIGFPVFTSVWGSAVLPAPFLNLSAIGSITVANAVAYVLNIVTNESTRYTNQNWDHIVVLGNKPYGVTSTGLYLLEGSTDNGIAIDTYMATKETDLGTNMAKSIPTIYLNSDTLTYTTAYMDGVAQTPQASSFTGRKCHLSRGAEARYVKLKISGIKNLQGLEILPEIKSRRVK